MKRITFFLIVAVVLLLTLDTHAAKITDKLSLSPSAALSGVKLYNLGGDGGVKADILNEVAFGFELAYLQTKAMESSLDVTAGLNMHLNVQDGVTNFGLSVFAGTLKYLGINLCQLAWGVMITGDKEQYPKFVDRQFIMVSVGFPFKQKIKEVVDDGNVRPVKIDTDATDQAYTKQTYKSQTLGR